MSRYSEVLLLQHAYISLPDREVLRDIHMALGEGEFCYIRGRSGSGKSALIDALYGLNILNGNVVKVLGREIPRLDRRELALYRRSIGYVSKKYDLLEGLTVFQNLDRILANIDWPVASDREKRINEVLHMAGLGDLHSEQINRLSEGQEQKLRICRAVLNKPKLILADAPTAGLDTQSVEEVMDLLINLASESRASIIWATASEFIPDRYPARSYICADGTITEMG